MKKIIYTALFAGFLASCGQKNQSIDELIAKGDLKAMHTKKTELAEQFRTLEAELTKLDSALGLLNKNEKYPLVTTLKVENQVFNHYLELQGDVNTKQNVLIYPEMAGPLQRVYVTEGQRVRKGQLLASIDDGGMTSQLAQAKTQADLAKTTFERQTRLWDQKIGSEMQYLQSKSNYEAAQNSVAQIQSQLSKSQIRAPFSGIIDDVIKDQGTVVAPGPGSEVFRIVNLSHMFIKVDIPERYLGDVVPGKEALVYFPVLGDTVKSEVRQTGNFINPNNRAFTAEIPVTNKNGNIKPNLTAKVRINDYTSTEAIIIPQSIISENAEGQQFVYLAEKDSDSTALVRKTIIKTGRSNGSDIEVLSGVQAGNELIKEGARNVKEGQEVEILKLD